MAAILGVFCLILALTSAEDWSAPWFCNGYECPQYELIREYETFEERYYNASRWIMTGIESTASSVVYDGFMKLYGYIDGENKRSQEIPMTLPVIVATSQSDNEEDRASISFYVPPNFDLPAPTNADIWSVNRPEGRVYVRTFGGIASESDWLANVSELREDLFPPPSRGQSGLSLQRLHHHHTFDFLWNHMASFLSPISSHPTPSGLMHCGNVGQISGGLRKHCVTVTDGEVP